MVKEENKISVPKSLTTEAWLLMGLTGSSQGIMKLEKGNLSFSIYGRGNLSFWHLRELKKMMAVKDLIKKLKADKIVELFKVPLKKVKVSYPWYYFGGGCMISIEDIKIKISFMKPANTEFNVKNPAMPIDSRRKVITNNLSNLKKGMDVAKLWKEVFLKNKVIQN